MEIKFLKAKPVWLDGKLDVINLHSGFHTAICCNKNERITVRIAASTMYRMFVNNIFVCYGPARGPLGFFRIDEIDISSYVNEGNNVIAIEVVAQNSKGYAFVDQKPFFCCEILSDGKIMKATGNEKDFLVKVVTERYRKTQRFGFQRPCWESYHFAQGWDNWRTSTEASEEFEVPVLVEDKKFISRTSDYPLYEKLSAKSIITRGAVDFNTAPEKYHETADCYWMSPKYKFYPKEELEIRLTDEAQYMKFTPEKSDLNEAADCFKIEENGYAIIDMGLNTVGFTGFTIEVEKPISLYLICDEILVDGDIDFLRATVCNVMRLDFDKGCYDFLSFEPWGYKFLKLVAKDGECKIKNLHIREFKHPPVSYTINLPKGNEKLATISAAALETYRLNSLDIFMDCPSRERAGWLCDSFFTSRVEYCMTGDSKIETDFLENFLIAESFPDIPDGMLPMCYPADHTDENYISNWAMWLVIELAEYKNRAPREDIIPKFKEKIYKLWDFFKKYENSDGLLEKLDKWVFVEWSRANELVQDVNYPTNMLYATMLDSIDLLYGDKIAKQRAQEIREKVREQAFDGKFFIDCAKRNESGELVPFNESTEVCQYYAFFTKTATPELYSELWNTLLVDFDPGNRVADTKFPKVTKANAFIGNYLRLESMMRYGLEELVLKNIESYFYDMACLTGTLWEHYDTRASCNHGFASHILYWLDKIYGKNRV